MKNKTYQQKSGIGSRNPENKVTLYAAEDNTIGVQMEREGMGHKPIAMTLLVPTTRSECGSRRVAELSLTGTQARELYRALDSFYTNHPRETR